MLTTFEDLRWDANYRALLELARKPLEEQRPKPEVLPPRRRARAKPRTRGEPRGLGAPAPGRDVVGVDKPKAGGRHAFVDPDDPQVDWPDRSYPWDGPLDAGKRTQERRRQDKVTLLASGVVRRTQFQLAERALNELWRRYPAARPGRR